ncbi:MAG: hypothetical protein V7K97_24860 [Nostoc sp.]|uniref:hypothetical protein n=1 Tax=Nostoc sp. TaxID=1180 RepID=UPI002FF63ADC
MRATLKRLLLPDFYWRGKQKNYALDVGWVERSATQHPDICWLWQSLQRHLLQRS